MGEIEPKKRKPRKDKGKKRGKRMAKPRFQTGSIDFRTIGTQQTMGQNATLLAGLLSSSRAMMPYPPPQQTTIPDIQKMISTELIKYAPRDLPNQPPTSQESFVPPPAQEPDTQQAQEEGQEERAVLKLQRQALTANIRNLRKGKEKLQEEFKQTQEKLFYSQQQQEQLQEELTANSKKLIEQEQIKEGLQRDIKQNLVEKYMGAQRSTLLRLVKKTPQQMYYETIKGLDTSELDDMRFLLLKEQQGITRNQIIENPKGGRGGGINWMLAPAQDLQRAQEEKPQSAEQVEEGLFED